MWANAKCDGCPAEYRWCHLYNAAVWLTPTTRVPFSNAAKRAKVHHVVRTCGGRHCCLTSFFDCQYMPKLQRQTLTKLRDGAQMANFLGPVFSVSRVQHISDLHSKFALRPHHV